MFAVITQNSSEIFSHPISFFVLFAVLAFIFMLFRIRHIKFTTNMIVHIALMLALTFLLHQLSIYQMPQGGSITFGAMIPLLLISYRYGPVVGCLTGFLYGMINLFQNPFILHPVQVLFDYPLPFMVLGTAALWPHHRRLSTLLAFGLRFVCHFISGAVFFGSYAPEGTSPFLYSLIFNATYLLPEFAICFILLYLLPIKRLLAAMDPQTPSH